MYKAILLFFCTMVLFGSCAQQRDNNSAKMEKKTTSVSTDTIKKVNHTEEEWKKILTPQQYHVLREKGTDAPFTGKLTYNKEKGSYYCAACGQELFTSDMKFESSCGWPSFDKEIAGGRIRQVTDTTHGMVRTEILCARCGSHLGHIFNDGPTLTGLRYCVNSTSLEFKKEE